MRVHIVPNLQKIRAPGTTRELIRLLHAYGCTMSMDQSRREAFGDMPLEFGPCPQLLRQCDLAIAIGGDGTILHAAKETIKADRPILGINGGTVGFLAAGESCDLPRLMKKLVEGHWSIEERMVLAVELSDGSYSDLAINDAVLSRGPSSHLVEADVYCDGRYTDSYRSDGIILATPTGSTAYSLAAGGPVVDPTLDTILLTPVCPYTLAARATMFAPQRHIRVTVGGGSDRMLYLSVDGREPVAVPAGLSVAIGRARQRAKFITFGETLFFEVLSKKINQRGQISPPDVQEGL